MVHPQAYYTLNRLPSAMPDGRGDEDQLSKALQRYWRSQASGIAMRRCVSVRFRCRARRFPLPVSHPTPQPASCTPSCVDASFDDRSQWFANEVHSQDWQLKAYLRNSFPRVRDVDDIVQESYLRIWATRATQPIQSARAFLFQIARRLALDFVRREQASPIDRASDAGTVSVADDRLDVVASVSRQEKIRLLADAVDTLPRRCREIFILRRLQGVPQREVAARLGISERTVEVQVLRGLKRCEAYLRQRGVRGYFDHGAD